MGASPSCHCLGDPEIKQCKGVGREEGEKSSNRLELAGDGPESDECQRQHDICVQYSKQSKSGQERDRKR